MNHLDFVSGHKLMNVLRTSYARFQRKFHAVIVSPMEYTKAPYGCAYKLLIIILMFMGQMQVPDWPQQSD